MNPLDSLDTPARDRLPRFLRPIVDPILGGALGEPVTCERAKPAMWVLAGAENQQPTEAGIKLPSPTEPEIQDTEAAQEQRAQSYYSNSLSRIPHPGPSAAIQSTASGPFAAAHAGQPSQ